MSAAGPRVSPSADGAFDRLAGRLQLRPGQAQPVRCNRPLVGAAMLQRLTAGRRAALLPDLVATAFTLCADAQRSTARRAVQAALQGACTGGPDAAAVPTGAAATEARCLALHTAREHLQRLALDLPQRTAASRADAPSTAGAPLDWLRDAPVMALPAGSAITGTALQSIEQALPAWLERRLFGMPARAWQQAWHEDDEWLARWAHSQRGHPVAQWLLSVRDAAQAIAWPCRALAPGSEAPAALPQLARHLAHNLAQAPGFAEAPLWQGRPAETGPWARAAQPRLASTGPMSVWRRLGARLAELADIAEAMRANEADAPCAGHAPFELALALGALPLAPGEGVAWTEMSRGLLLHWVRLAPGPQDAGGARVEAFRVLAPTEWNFHPQGGFASWLRTARPEPAAVRLACAALDPCVAFDVVDEGLTDPVAGPSVAVPDFGVDRAPDSIAPGRPPAPQEHRHA